MIVYSPKTFSETVHRAYLDRIDSSPHALCTIEWGENKTHKHANYFYYSHHKDAYNLARSLKEKKPEVVVKACSNVANAIQYMTKEGKRRRPSAAGKGGVGGVSPPVE